MTQPVFTCSMAVSASGHSLLALLLDAHPLLTHPGDTILSAHLFESANCACGKRHAECEFWTEVTDWEGYAFLRDHIQRGLLKTFYSLPGLFLLQRMELAVHPGLRRYAQTLLAYPRRIKEITGAHTVIYGRKRLVDLLLPLAAGAPVRILHLTKHPIA